MIKYVVVPTTQCNFIVAGVDMDPVYNAAGDLERYRLVSTQRDLPRGTVSWWKIQGVGRNPQLVFDTMPEAENYAKSQMQVEKDKHIKKFESYLKFYQKKLDKIFDHNPKVRFISLVK